MLTARGPAVSRRSFLAGGVGLGALALAGCSGDDEGRPLEFFQFKGEALDIMNELVDQWNAGGRGPAFYQNQVADATVNLRTRLIKERVPDAITLNGDLVFGELSTAGVFHDFTGSEVLGRVQPEFAQILPTLGASAEGAVNGLPFSNNACGVIYNRTLFEDRGYAIPQTWEELLAICEEEGENALAWGMLDSWTALPMFNGLSANVLQQPVAEWYAARLDGSTTFADDYVPILERMETLYGFGNRDKAGLNYDAANRLFSQGEHAMYLQGNWAVPAVRSLAKDIDLGVFPMPGDTAGEARIVTGVDVALTLPRDGAHHEAAMEFLDFLMQEDTVARYNTEQAMLPTLAGMKAEDPALGEAQQAIDEGRLATFSDHNVPQSVNLGNYLQAMLFGVPPEATAATLDREWDKVQARRQFGREDS